MIYGLRGAVFAGLLVALLAGGCSEPDDDPTPPVIDIPITDTGDGGDDHAADDHADDQGQGEDQGPGPDGPDGPNADSGEGPTDDGFDTGVEDGTDETGVGGDPGGEPDGDPGGEGPGTDGCVPDCTNKTCGNDGCNGSCGECPEHYVCTPGSFCEAIPFTCAEPETATELPWSAAGNTTTHLDTGSCSGLGVGAPDVVYAHYGDGLYRARIVEANFDAVIHVATTCGDPGTCLVEASDDVVFTGVSPGPAYVTVDGATPDDSGSFSILVESCESECPANTCGVGACGSPCACDFGFYCSEAGGCEPAGLGDDCLGSLLPVPSLPLVETLTFDMYNDSTTCVSGPIDSKDAVYVFAPFWDVVVNVSLDGAEGSLVRVAENCDELCAGAVVAAGESLGMELSQGTTYLFQIEAGGGSEATLIVSECPVGTCGPLCPCPLGDVCVDGTCEAPTSGDICTDKVALTAGSQEHSTKLMADAVACDGAPDGTVDALFELVADAAGHWQVVAAASHALGIYALGDCTDASSCTGFSIGEPAVLDLSLEADEAATIVVEEVGQGGGGFELVVTNCTAGCVDQPCDALVCGALCGCAEGQVCGADACVEAGPGDSCATALVVDAAPSVVPGDLDGMSDSLGCGEGAGLSTADAIYSFVAPSTGVFQAAVVGPEQPVVLLPDGCVGGGQTCAAAPLDKLSFFLHQGEERVVAVDGSGAYVLTFTRVLGLSGGLGSACTTDADCPLADACALGVCTVKCADGDQACIGVAPGPRGTDYSCSAGTCLPGTGAVCASGADCVDEVCAGFVTIDGAAGSVCVPAGSLLAVGEPCADDAACATGVCSEGVCLAVCKTTLHCEADHKCELWPTPAGAGGACQSKPGASASSCAVDEDCPDGVCEGSMTPALLPEFYCQPAVGTGGGGSPCALDSSCASGTCLFAGVSGLVQPYCRDVCASAADCAVGFDCRLFGVWHANTPADPDDDAALPICVRGGVDETCPLVGPNICDEGLVCVPKLPSQDFGACGSPDPP